MNRKAPKGLLIFVTIIGILMFSVSTYLDIKRDLEYKDYIDVKAYFMYEKGIPVEEDENEMYKLTYEYQVNGKKYLYTTDYATSVIPEKGSDITIKYNPNNPSDAYSEGMNGLVLFKLIGTMFIVLPMAILFADIIWLRDILLLIFSSIFLYTFISLELYYGIYILALIIISVFFVVPLYEIIKLITTGNFKPIEDIKREIEISREIKKQKKLENENATIEEKEKNKKRTKKIIIGLLMFLVPLPSVIIFDIKIGFQSEILYIILSIIASGLWMAGFGMFFGGLVMGNSQNSPVIVAGEVIEPEVIKNSDKMPFKEKIKAFRIIETILSILSIPAFLMICYFIFEDPLKIFQNFEFVARAQLYTILIILLIVNVLYLVINKIHLSKFQLLSIIGSYIAAFLLFYSMTIPNDEYRTTLTEKEFKSIMENNNFSITNYKNIGNLDIKDSEIIAAENNNIKFYYIISDSRKTARKIDEAIEDVEYGDCNVGGLYAISENRKSVVCQNPSYIRISYKIKNTIMIAESNNIEAEKYLNNLLNDLGYNKSDYER